MRGLTYTVKLQRCKQHGKNARPNDCAVCKELISTNRQAEDKTHDRNERRSQAHGNVSRKVSKRKKARKPIARKPRKQTAAAEANS